MAGSAQCVIPSESEQELAVLPGNDPGTAIRVLAETGADGYVRLQQMAHTEGLGWYVQRSFVVPREMLALLATELRKANCLMPPAAPSATAAARPAPPANPLMRLVGDDDQAAAKRVGA